MAVRAGALAVEDRYIHLADVLLVTGSNTTEAHPVISLEMKKAVNKRGARLILIDPRQIGWRASPRCTCARASGTDVALLNTMAHVIIAEGLAKLDFIAARTENFEAFNEAVKDCTPQWGEDITGVPAELIVEAARLYGRAGSAAIFWAMGITQSSHGVDNVQALANLALLTGNFGKPGSGVNPLRGQNNVQGACDVGGLPNVITGYQPVIHENVDFSGIVSGRNPMRILDVGCGSGIVLQSAHRANRNATGVGLDSDDAVVLQAKENLAQWDLDDAFRILQGDIRHPPEEIVGPFDLITLFNILYYFNEEGRADLIRGLRAMPAPQSVLAVAMNCRSRGMDVGAANLNVVNCSLKGLTRLPDLNEHHGIAESMRVPAN